MADDTKATETASPASAKKTVKAGDKVHLVHARRGHMEAEVNKVNRDGTVDLETRENDLHTGKPIVITGSPRDDGGARYDSWHHPEPLATTEK